jgi:hypothetical protein
LSRNAAEGALDWPLIESQRRAPLIALKASLSCERGGRAPETGDCSSAAGEGC